MTAVSLAPTDPMAHQDAHLPHYASVADPFIWAYGKVEELQGQVTDLLFNASVAHAQDSASSQEVKPADPQQAQAEQAKTEEDPWLDVKHAAGNFADLNLRTLADIGAGAAAYYGTLKFTHSANFAAWAARKGVSAMDMKLIKSFAQDPVALLGGAAAEAGVDLAEGQPINAEHVKAGAMAAGSVCALMYMVNYFKPGML